MKKIICISLIILMFSTFVACGTNGHEDDNDNILNNNYATNLTDLETSPTENAEADSYEVLKMLIESQNNLDWASFNSLFYGDFDYNKAINLYYECLVDIYGQESVDIINENTKEKYGTTDYKVAFELYFPEFHSNYKHNLEEFSYAGTVPPEKTAEYIDDYNSNISSMSYASCDHYHEMGDSYGDYMYEATTSMHININDVQEMVEYKYPAPEYEDNDYYSIYLVKVDGEWYPLAEVMLTEFEYFASAMGG